jgi:hypothetical protein
MMKFVGREQVRKEQEALHESPVRCPDFSRPGPQILLASSGESPKFLPWDKENAFAPELNRARHRRGIES